MCVLILLCGCDGDSANLHTVLIEVCRMEAILPAGELRFFTEETEDVGEEAVSSLQLAQIYGNGNVLPAMDGVLEAAFRFSYSHPFELAVFRCENADAAHDVAKLCLHRLDILKEYWGKTEYAPYAENGVVQIYRNYVLLVVSVDSSATLHALRRCL